MHRILEPSLLSLIMCINVDISWTVGVDARRVCSVSLPWLTKSSSVNGNGSSALISLS
jgi:hypothetical protein